MIKSITPSDNKKFKAVVMIADLEGSSTIANNSGILKYNELIREFHKTAEKVIDKYCFMENIFHEDIFKRAYGDEVLVVLSTIDQLRNVKIVLTLAALQIRDWERSEFFRDIISHSKKTIGIRIGISLGEVLKEKSVWNQGYTMEGIVFSRAKRIEGLAAKIALKTKILVEAGETTQGGTLIKGVKEIIDEDINNITNR